MPLNKLIAMSTCAFVLTVAAPYGVEAASEVYAGNQPSVNEQMYIANADKDSRRAARDQRRAARDARRADRDARRAQNNMPQQSSVPMYNPQRVEAPAQQQPAQRVDVPMEAPAQKQVYQPAPRGGSW